MLKRLNSNQMCEKCSYKEGSYREVLLYINLIYKYSDIKIIKIIKIPYLFV